MRKRIFVLLVSALISSTAAFADVVVAPKDGSPWGNPNEADELLKMNKDPDIIRKANDDPNDQAIETDVTGTDVHSTTQDAAATGRGTSSGSNSGKATLYKKSLDLNSSK